MPPPQSSFKSTVQLGAVVRPWGVSSGMATLGCGFLSRAQVPASKVDPGSPDYRWLLVLAGSGSAVDETGVRHVLRPGSLFVRAPHMPHTVVRDDSSPWLEYFIRVPLALQEFLIEASILDPAVRRAELVVDAHAQRCLTFFRDVLSHPGSTHAAILTALFAVLALAPASGISGNDGSADALENARLALAADLQHPLALEPLAVAAGYSVNGFRVAFGRRFGCNPKLYRMRARIAAAQALLLEGRSVAAAASELGYPDVSTFAKQFRLLVGQTAAQYRSGT